MKRKNIDQWLDEKSSQINTMILIMCKMHISDASYTFRIEHAFGGGSWCSIDNHKHSIIIHVGIHEWLDDDCPDRQPYVDALGREPNEKDLFAIYMGLAMHEFMHACITRTGNTIQQIAMKFPMQTKTASRYQQEFYKQNVEGLIHFWHNCVCDPRIENIGKNLYNVAQYFDFGRILDYMVATSPGPTKSWNLGYAMLQLGVIGDYPLFEIDPEAKKAIEALRNVSIPGSTAKKDLLTEFICEPHPTISVKKFAAWFDVPEFHDYVEKIIFEEIETQCKAAEKLANMLANMPKEVQISGGSSGGSGIALNLPPNITVKQPGKNSDGKATNKSNQDDGEQKDGNGGNGSEGKKGDKKDSNKESGSGNGKDKDSKKQGSGGSSEQSEQNADGDSKKSDGNGQQSGDSNSNSQSNGQSSVSNQPCQESHSTEDHDTFDENGEWSLSESDDSGNNEDALEEHADLREALDEAIAEIGKAAKAVTTKKSAATTSKKSTVKVKSNADVVIDTSFVPQKFAPAKIIAAAKPLRAVIKKLFSENQEDEITGLKAGSLNTRALYRLKDNNLSVFKERKLPTIVDAVYYICWDGSGSMCGSKQSQSAYACAVIEEAVRGLYPMKIINFSTHGSVVHYIVKDFDDRSKKNAAYSFGAQRYFSGGNKDGYSIRQCTEELIKRKEANKFLIVLSDGAPSDYGSHREAIDDVKSAVAFARANKIDVTSIFFGAEYERDSQIDLYNEMYGASHMISCDPSEIVNHMVRIVKKNIMKR
jgi:hypothetical protein